MYECPSVREERRLSAPPVCEWCGESKVEFDGDRCDTCEGLATEREEDDAGCDWCGTPLAVDEGRFCSRACARASESDHA